MAKVITGFQDYTAHRGGYISRDGKALKPGITWAGYQVVSLCMGNKKSTRSVHRIIAETFLPPVPGKTLVNHIDEDKLNNRVENLEWVTAKENSQHSIGKFSRGEGQHLAKLTWAKVGLMRDLFILGVTKSSIATGFDICARTAGRVINGDTWKGGAPSLR